MMVLLSQVKTYVVWGAQKRPALLEWAPPYSPNSDRRFWWLQDSGTLLHVAFRPAQAGLAPAQHPAIAISKA